METTVALVEPVSLWLIVFLLLFEMLHGPLGFDKFLKVNIYPCQNKLLVYLLTYVGVLVPFGCRKSYG